MDEDEEEYYDSLDEETSLEPPRLNLPSDNVLYEYEENHSQHSRVNYFPDNELGYQRSENDIAIKPEYIEIEEKQDVRKKKEHGISTKIPLYVGEIDKEELITKLCTIQKSSNTGFAGDTTVKPKPKIDSMKKKSENSYWNIYCQKNKLPVASDDNPLKSFFASTKTFSCLLNSSSCLSGSTWDAPSVFEKYMPKTYATPKPDSCTYDEEDIERSTSRTSRLPTFDVDLENIKSISHTDLHSKNSKTSKASKCKSNTSTNSFRPLTLKCGLDSEKMELIRKQQEYGIKASSRNRARIIQNLTKLKQELKDDRKGISQ